MYSFNYHKPTSTKNSIELFKKSEFPIYIAGGMTMIPSMKQKLSTPTDIIDLQQIDELKGIHKLDNKIIIGALTTHNEVANSILIKENIRGLSYLASKIADNAIRNLGTIGGSICNADPAADYPAALLSLNATITTNNRDIKAKDFFIDMFETNLEDYEIVKYITFPIINNSYYLKIASQASKYAIIGIFGSSYNNQLSISVTGAANKVFSLDDINALSIEKLKTFDFEALNLNKFNINSDIHASSIYRTSLIKSMLPKLIQHIF